MAARIPGIGGGNRPIVLMGHRIPQRHRRQRHSASTAIRGAR
jgi:hypothetical protein